MSKKNKNLKTKKQLCKVNKKWVTLATTSAVLLGAGGILPGIAGSAATVQAANEESNVSETAWSANTVQEVEQEIAAQNSADTSSYQIRWGDTLSALSMATGLSVDEMAAQNGIENPDLIYAGDFLSKGKNTDPVTEETESVEASEVEKPKATEEITEEEAVEEPEEQTTEAPAEEETVEAREEVSAEQTVQDQEEEAVVDEAAETEDAETTEGASEEVTEDEPEEEITEPDTSEEQKEEAEEEPEETTEIDEPEETTDEEPVAKVAVPEEIDEEPEEEDVPEEIEEEVDVQEVTTAEETVEPEDEVDTDQSVAVVTEPESHTESSAGFIQPAQGYVSSGYGYRTNPFSGIPRLHAGLDIAGKGDILAAQSGTVVAATSHSGWGNYVKIDHGNGIETLYAHMANGSIPVSVGDTVSQGQTIGKMGQTGSATGIHLHFEVYVNGVQVDPAPYL